MTRPAQQAPAGGTIPHTVRSSRSAHFTGWTYGENGSANDIAPHLNSFRYRLLSFLLAPKTDYSTESILNLARIMKHHHGHPQHTDSTVQTDIAHTLSHEDISQCARELWAQQGCPENRDEAIWLEAESRLLASRRGASRSLPAVGSVR